MLTSGQLLAERYRLGRRIAVGGMGEVWEAEDTRLDRKVAVKVLKPELCGDAEFLHRFRTEARTTASLNHPGIAAVHDYGETAAVPDGPQDTAYLVMELVEGEPLATIISTHGSVTPERTLEIIEQAGNALQAAHERGYVHRDVKPGNILVINGPGNDITVKVTDFGIAKAADAAPVTRSGMVMGTAHYIAPEQALGNEAEPASDVYSLAVVGYECLVGHRPFLSENAVTVAMMHIREAAPPLPPEVPPGVRALIEATLVKDPRQRYRSGGEFAAAAAAVRSGLPLPTPSGLVVAGNPHPNQLGNQLGTQLGSPLGNQLSSPLGNQLGNSLGNQLGMPMSQGGLPARGNSTMPPSAPVGVPSGGPIPQQGHPSVDGPPTGPVHTGTFLPPPQPRQGRTGLWVLLGIVAVVIVALGLWVVFTFAQRQPTPRHSSDSHGSTTTVGAREPGTGNIDGRMVGVDEQHYLNESADKAAATLARLGLQPDVRTPNGSAPPDLRRCTVTGVTPSGQVPVGSKVAIRCTVTG